MYYILYIIYIIFLKKLFGEESQVSWKKKKKCLKQGFFATQSDSEKKTPDPVWFLLGLA